MNTLFTGHEADVAATEGGKVQGELVTLHVRIGGCAGVSLAHPCLSLGKQDDGSVVLAVTAYRPFERSLQAVTADVLATAFVPRPPNWAESVPDWRVDEWDTKGRDGRAALALDRFASIGGG